MKRAITAPLTYAAWAVIVVVALVGTYPVDSYVFGFTTLGLAWLTGAIAIAGLIGCTMAGWRLGPSFAILGSLAVAAGAVATALNVVSGFKWA